jgi:8-oxo-dGTP pyrophosphatase MutT (NUDIX family)
MDVQRQGVSLGRVLRAMNEDEIRARLLGQVHAPLDYADYWPSAVLVPLEPGRGVWLTLRANDQSSHAGQVAFPGGRIESFDESPEAAALREAWEEIGLRREDVTLLGRMDDTITGTGYHVTPVLALVKPGVQFTPSVAEVAAVFCLPFETLLDPGAAKQRKGFYRGQERHFWIWPKAEHLIWGATAEILVHLARRLRGDP